jgi:hypothetical protein
LSVTSLKDHQRRDARSLVDLLTAFYAAAVAIRRGSTANASAISS